MKIHLHKHEGLKEQLMQKVSEAKAGEKFMSVREIMKKYQVSQLTVDKALESLCKDGALVKYNGHGIYVPEKRASGLEGVKGARLALAIPDFQCIFFTYVMNELKANCERVGMTLHPFYYDCRKYSIALPFHADALCIIPVPVQIQGSELAELEKLGIPVVFYDTVLTGVAVDFVCVDDELGGAMGADYLMKRGHKKIAVLAAEPMAAPSITLRSKTFKVFSEMNGVEADIIDCGTLAGEHSRLKAYEKVTSLIECGNFNYSGIFCLCDDAAMGLLKALSDKGIRVPDDISVVGFDGAAAGAFYNPPLTSFGIDYPEFIGELFNIIVKRLSGVKGAPMQIKMRPHLVERESASFYKEERRKAL